MNSRILLILKTKDISASKFADEIGVQRSSISHILSGRNNPSLDFIQKTLARFPDISPDWILTGKGSMYLEPDLFNSVDIAKTEARSKNEKIMDTDKAEVIENYPTMPVFEEIEVEKHQKPKQIKATEKSDDNEEKKPQNVIMKAVGKKIERIIIFYSDKSCIEYIPE